MADIQGMFGQDPALLQQAIQQQKMQQYQQAANVPAGRGFVNLAAQSGGMLGDALSSAAGYQDPRMAAAMQDQQVQQQAMEQAKMQGINPAEQPEEFLKLYANTWMQAGKPDKAFPIVQQLQAMQAQKSKIGLESAQAAKALREPVGPQHMSDLGKYQYELDTITQQLEQDPNNPRLQAMKQNYEAKIKRFSQGDEGALARDVAFLQSKGMPEEAAIGIKAGVYAVVPTSDGGVKIIDKRQLGTQTPPVWQTGSTGQQPSQFQVTAPVRGEVLSIPGIKPQERLDKSVVDIGQDIEKAKITDQKNTLQGVMQQFDTLNKKYKGNVPGVGPVEGAIPTWAISNAEGRQLRDSIQQAFNITLKDRSGAAVTNQELERLKSEFAKGAFRSEADMREALQRANNIILKHEQSIINTYPEEARVEYLKRTGRDWYIKNPTDVRVSYKAGKITKEEARQLLMDMEKEGIK